MNKIQSKESLEQNSEKEELRNLRKKGWIFLFLASMAFAGLGLEMILAFAIEPLIYGVGINEFNTTQSILHWVITCILWGISAFLLIFFAKRKINFDIFKCRENIKLLNWVLCFVCLAVSVTISI